mgnify:CR=1 FL=1
MTITANLNPGYTVGEALAFMEEVANRALSPGYPAFVPEIRRQGLSGFWSPSLP